MLTIALASLLAAASAGRAGVSNVCHSTNYISQSADGYRDDNCINTVRSAGGWWWGGVSGESGGAGAPPLGARLSIMISACHAGGQARPRCGAGFDGSASCRSAPAAQSHAPSRNEGAAAATHYQQGQKVSAPPQLQ